MLKEKIKRFGINHPILLSGFRKTFGRIKTKYFFAVQSRYLRNNGESLISMIDQVLSKAGARYFVDCGTLLGYIRDNKPIEYDRDLDFGIYFDDKFTPQMLENAMTRIGLHRITIGYIENEVQAVTYAKGILHVDFFRHTEVKNNSLLYVLYRDPSIIYPSNEHCSVIVQKRAHITGLQRAKIGDIETNIPEHVEEYLASAYTDNWTTPDPNWQYTMEPGCTYLNIYGIKRHQ